MHTRQLGKSDMHFTVIGFGAWAIGGSGWAFSWGQQDDQDSITAIKRAIELGINWIDTAHVYGFGHSEEVVGKAIAEQRDEVFVATKCGLVRGEDGSPMPKLTADSVRKELEGSLVRLGVDVIDLYQIHWPKPEDEIEEAWGAIAKAIEEGKVRYGGVSNFNVEQLKRAQAIHPVTSLQPPYSMFRRGIEDELVPYCREQNIGIINYSPMMSGLLTGKVTQEWVASLDAEDWRRRTAEYADPNLSINIDFVEKTLRPIADKYEVQPGQIAVAWVLRRDLVTSAIVGARNPKQIEQTVRAADIHLTDDELNSIEEGLVERAEKLKAAGV